MARRRRASSRPSREARSETERSTSPSPGPTRDPFSGRRKEPLPQGPIAEYLSQENVRAAMTPQRNALRSEMKTLCAAYYSDEYLLSMGGQKKPTTMKIHNDLKDWLRHRDDLNEEDVDQYSYNHTNLMIKTEIARRRDDLGIRHHQEGSQVRRKNRKGPIVAQNPDSKKFTFIANLWDELCDDDDDDEDYTWVHPDLVKMTARHIKRAKQELRNR
ncbi:CCD97-like C-terminal domain-containing protein [Plasmodiophora brassicae]